MSAAERWSRPMQAKWNLTNASAHARTDRRPDAPVLAALALDHGRRVVRAEADAEQLTGRAVVRRRRGGRVLAKVEIAVQRGRARRDGPRLGLLRLRRRSPGLGRRRDRRRRGLTSMRLGNLAHPLARLAHASRHGGRVDRGRRWINSVARAARRAMTPRRAVAGRSRGTQTSARRSCGLITARAGFACRSSCTAGGPRRAVSALLGSYADACSAVRGGSRSVRRPEVAPTLTEF